MSGTAPQPRLDREHPWPALLAFREDDQQFFGGRGEEVEALYRRIVSSRLTLLFSLSGLGKSSLLRAGLFPRLRGEHYFPVYIRLRYGRDLPPPVAQIKAAIVEQARAARIEAPEPHPDETLWQYFHRPDADFWDERNHPTTPVLVFDQFEELFTKGRELPEQANTIIEELADLAEGAAPASVRDAAERNPSLLRQVFEDRYRLLFAIRSDYLAQLQGISDRVRAVFANRYELSRMSGAAALESTLTAGGHLLDEDVARRIVRFVAGAKESGDAQSVGGLAVEPALLSLVCSELNATRVANGEPRITASMLSGTKDEILWRFYEGSLADVAPELRQLVEDKLVTRDGKGRNFISEQTARETPGVTDEDLAKLVHRRLLRFEESGSSRRMELTHDLLTTVAAASRATREQRRQLDEAERARAEAEQREAEARRKLRRSRMVAALFLVLLAAAVAGPFIAAHWTAIGAKKVEADSAFRLAVQKLTSDEPTEGLAYLARVIRLDPGNAAARTFLYEQLITRSWPVPIRSFGPAGRIDGAVFNREGTRVVFHVGNVIEMWDVATGKRIGAIESDLKPEYTHFAADGWTLLQRFGKIGMWDPRTNQRVTDADIHKLIGGCSPYVHDLSANAELAIEECGLSILPLRGGPVERPLQYRLDFVQFLSDPRFVVVDRSRNDRDILLIDRQTPATPRRITETAKLWDISAGGRFFLIGRDEMELEAWDTGSWANAGKRVNNQSAPRSAAFDPAAEAILTVAEDDGIRVWKVEDGTKLFKSLWHPQVKVAAFSVDGARILTASDRTARWWDAHDGAPLAAAVVEPKMLTAHLDDHGNIVTVTSKARVWDLATALLPPALPHGVVAGRLSADSTLAIDEPLGKERKVYDVATGKLLWKLPDSTTGFPHPQFRRSLKFGDDGVSMVDAKSGKVLWTADLDFSSFDFSDDGTAVLFATNSSDESKPGPLVILLVETGKPIGPLVKDGRIEAKSRDASLLAIRLDRQLAVRDVRTQRTIMTIPAAAGAMTVAFSDDGKKLVTVSSPVGLQVWNIATGKAGAPARQLREHFIAARFSPDGRRLALTSENGVLLCDARTLDCDDEPLAHAGVNQVELSADGSRMMTATDNDLRVWDVATRQPLTPSLPRNRETPVGLAPDGMSVFGLGDRDLARVPVPVIDDDDADRLATIAEALAGVRIDRLGVTEPVDGLEVLAGLESQCRSVKSRACDIVRWLRTPPAKRTISPVSNITAADYVRVVVDNPDNVVWPGNWLWWWMKARFTDQPALRAK